MFLILKLISFQVTSFILNNPKENFSIASELKHQISISP